MNHLRPQPDHFAAIVARAGASLREVLMDGDEIAELYQWTRGSCFRCARTGLDTTSLDQIETPAGVRYDVRACLDCVLDLEYERERRAQRAGLKYTPGLLGL